MDPSVDKTDPQMDLYALGKDELIHIIEMLADNKIIIKHSWTYDDDLEEPPHLYPHYADLWVEVTYHGLMSYFSITGTYNNTPQTIPPRFTCTSTHREMHIVVVESSTIYRKIIKIIRECPAWEMYQWRGVQHN